MKPNPLDYPCPQCSAKAGAKCRNYKGHACAPHRDRGEPAEVKKAQAEAPLFADLDERPLTGTEEVSPDSLRPGDRCVMAFGVLTFDRTEATADGRVTLHWREAQPAVTLQRFNTVTVLEAENL